MEQMLEASQNVALIFSSTRPFRRGTYGGSFPLFFFSCSLGLRAGCRRFCGRICVGDGALLALLEGFRITDSQLVSMFVALG